MRYEGKNIKMLDEKGNAVSVKQVYKNTARKAYENGQNVWIYSCNLRLNSFWGTPYRMSKKEIENNPFTSASDFDALVASYTYYNCDNERGKYPIFFIPSIFANLKRNTYEKS